MAQQNSVAVDNPETGQMTRQEEDRISKEIDATLRRDKQIYDLKLKEPRLLLLGSGDSGKTTFLKQIKILHLGTFSEEEVGMFRHAIHINVLESIGRLVGSVLERGEEAEELGDVQAEMEVVQEYVSLRLKSSASSLDQFFAPIPMGVARMIHSVWKHPVVQAVYRDNPAELQLQDTAEYFLSRTLQICEPNYIPTNDDILHIRSPTTQISETTINVQQITFHFYDVGGQQKYRKQWTPYFDHVHNIVFICSLSSYNQMLIEDPTINRMHDAIHLFGKIINHSLLKHIPVTLFLNKRDLFEKKYPTSDVRRWFPNFNVAQTSDPKDVKRGIRFFEKKFLQQTDDPAKRIDTHVTCCTDTKAMGSIIRSVMKTIVDQFLIKSGINRSLQ